MLCLCWFCWCPYSYYLVHNSSIFFLKGSNGRGHFIFVTNLAPCSGVRLHLWPEKGILSSDDKISANKRIVDVTSKMVHIPSGPAPRQVHLFLCVCSIYICLCEKSFCRNIIFLFLVCGSFQITRLNQEAKLNKHLHRPCFNWVPRKCTVSDSWLFQLRLVRYCLNPCHLFCHVWLCYRYVLCFNLLHFFSYIFSMLVSYVMLIINKIFLLIPPPCQGIYLHLNPPSNF